MKTHKTVSSILIASLLLTQSAQASSGSIESLFFRAEYVSRVEGDRERAERELLQGLNEGKFSVSDLREYVVRELNERELAEFDARVAVAAQAGSRKDTLSRDQILALAGPVVASLGERGAHAVGSPASKAGAVILIVAGVVGALVWAYRRSHCTEINSERLCDWKDYANYRNGLEGDIRSSERSIRDNNDEIAKLEAEIASGTFYKWVDDRGSQRYAPLTELISDLKVKNEHSVRVGENSRVALELSYQAEQDLKYYRDSAKPYLATFLTALPAGIIWSLYAFNE